MLTKRSVHTYLYTASLCVRLIGGGIEADGPDNLNGLITFKAITLGRNSRTPMIGIKNPRDPVDSATLPVTALS